MRGEKGLTVIEILVALSLFGLGILAFLRTTHLSVGLHGKSHRISQALSLAEEQMEELQLRGWDETVADCALDTLAEKGVTGLQRTVTCGGERYCLVFDRWAASPFLECYGVTCFWEGPAGRFERVRSIRLSTARRSAP